MSAVGVTLAILAALLFAVSAALQQSTARTAALARPTTERLLPAIGLLATLIRSPRWLIGLAATVVGFGLHACALHFGSIQVVQAVLVVQLLFALPLSALRRRQRPLRRDWLGTVLVCTGLVTVVSQCPPRGAVRSDQLGVAVAVAVGAVALLVVAARRMGERAQARSALIGIAAGFCFCTTAVLVVSATAELPQLSWALPGIAVSTVLGGVLAQEAFASGSLPTALTSMTTTDPILSYVAGSTLFVVVAHPDPVVLIGAAVLVIAGVAMLANSPTLHDEDPQVLPQPTDALVRQL